MADKKISALTGSATPLAGSEVLPIVQSGATVKVSVDNLTAGKTVNTRNIIATVADDAYALAGNATTGNVRLIPYLAAYGSTVLTAFSAGYSGYGPLTIDTSNTRFWQSGVEAFRTSANGLAPVAGKGIDFSANTHAAGMTSELLNDYEEGTWTPSAAVNGFNGAPAITAITGTYTKVGRLVSVEMSVTLASPSYPATYSLFTGLPFLPAIEAAGCYIGNNAGSGVQGGNNRAYTSGQLWWWPSASTVVSSNWTASINYFV